MTYSDFITKALLIILLLGCAPLSYVYYFLLRALPRKYGYLRFAVFVMCYIVIIGLCTLFLSEGLFGLIIFFLIPNLIILGGAWVLRGELKESLRDTFRNKT